MARVKVSNRTEAADQHVYVTFEIETIEIFKVIFLKVYLMRSVMILIVLL